MKTSCFTQFFTIDINSRNQELFYTDHAGASIAVFLPRGAIGVHRTVGVARLLAVALLQPRQPRLRAN